MPRRLYRAWRFYIGLNYSWHLAWHKADTTIDDGPSTILGVSPRDMYIKSC